MAKLDDATGLPNLIKGSTKNILIELYKNINNIDLPNDNPNLIKAVVADMNSAKFANTLIDFSLAKKRDDAETAVGAVQDRAYIATFKSRIEPLKPKVDGLFEVRKKLKTDYDVLLESQIQLVSSLKQNLPSQELDQIMAAHQAKQNDLKLSIIKYLKDVRETSFELDSLTKNAMGTLPLAAKTDLLKKGLVMPEVDDTSDEIKRGLH